VASDPRTRFYVPAFSIPVFVPELIPALGRILQDGAQLGGVVSAPASP